MKLIDTFPDSIELPEKKSVITIGNIRIAAVVFSLFFWLLVTALVEHYFL